MCLYSIITEIMDNGFGDTIVTKCFEKYNKLGKTGKPQEQKEWTQLSCFLLESPIDLRVVSLATGTKCIGEKSMCPQGLIVNDSHAEVLARRGLLRYIYEEVRKCLSVGNSNIFYLKGDICTLKEDIWFHMFTSQVPCGDASIIPMKEEDGEPSRKRQRLDVHRTGAKPLAWEERQDSLEIGVGYHIKGAVRRKPGRGDPTLSLSCSDKIARWIHVGLQGALLSHYIPEPIRLRSLVIGGGGPFDEQVVYEALITRAKTTTFIPQIVSSQLVFHHSQYVIMNGKPAPASIIWADVSDKSLEVAVEGKRLGTTSKTRDKGRLKICKRELLKYFLSLSKGIYEKCSYREIKDKVVHYQELSNTLKLNMGSWSKKLEYENFVNV